MSAEANQQTEQVQDEEGHVARQLKDSILQIRSLVDEREDALFVEPMVEPELADRLDYYNAVDAWGNTVRQYIRKIRPLLINDNIEASKKYREEVDLGTHMMAPPNHDGYEFSKFAHPQIDEQKLLKHMGLPRGIDPPKPREFKFEGLLSLIETQRLSATWEVKISANGPPSEHRVIYPDKERPIPKYILENAVMQADEFLQQAGIGLSLDSGEPHGIT